MTDQDGEPKYIWTLHQWYAGQAPPMPPSLMRLAEEHADVENPEVTHTDKCKVLLEIIAIWNKRYADAMLADEQSEQGKEQSG